MKKNKPTRRIIIFFVIFSTSFTISQNKEDFLSLDRYLSWENIEAPQISPDGKKIIYSRKWVDSVNDTWENTLWIMDSDGSKNRFLVDGSSAKWSSDNKKIAFVFICFLFNKNFLHKKTPKAKPENSDSIVA